MKKHLKWLSVLMVLAMLVSMATAVAEDEKGIYSITINAAPDGHTYEAYQIFKGDYAAGDILSNIKWGSSVDGAYAAANDAVEKAKELSAFSSDVAKKAAADQFAAEIAPHLTAPKASTSTNSNGSYTIGELPAGYYLIKDKDNSLTNANDSYTLFMLQIVGDVSVEPKAEMPSFMKKVDDKNDSDAVEDGVQWQDSSDYDIGDNVPFLLVGKVAENYDAYTTYKFVFHDNAEQGLSFNAESVKAYVGKFAQVEGKNYFETSNEVAIDRQYFTVSSAENGNDFTVTFENLKDIKSGDQALVNAGDTILVEYTARLNEDAVIGSRGNKNTAYLQFSNNPNNEQGGELGKTPNDTVIVFTYKTVINKVDGDGNALDGADFKLEKLVGTEWQEVEKAEVAAATEPAAEGEEEASTAETTFNFIGIDAGRYCLSETKTPVGYNSIEPIYFTVTATHDILADNPALLTLSANETNDSGSNLATGEVARFAASYDLADGSLTSDIVNLSGAVLPSTGGIGTTIFYALGGLLVVAAAVLLITKRRMSSED